MKTIFCLNLFIACATLLKAQGGTVFDHLSMRSDILKSEKKYAVYLPPDYETSNRSYPVLYLLHGRGGNQSTWVQQGEVKHIADKAIQEGKSTPMIIVMPDASGPRRGYFNYPGGEWNYEDFFIREFMPFIENNYRIRPGKRYCSVAGLSMGGMGTFIFALRYPELFNSACPLSIGTGPTVSMIKERFGNINMEISESEAQEFYQAYNTLELIKRMPQPQRNAIHWYIDCGDDDPNQYEGSCRIHIAMRKLGIPHEFRVRDGAHNWIYWRSALPAVLEFVTGNIR